MIATGNHNFEKFAALCNTPGGSQGVQTISVYALLQGVCVHPGACKKTGLRADAIRPYPVRFKIWERLQNRTRPVGVAKLATRAAQPPWLPPGGSC